MANSEKKTAFFQIGRAHEIAGRLYEEGKRQEARGESKENPFRGVFGWIGEQVKKRRPLELIVAALKRVEEMESRGNSPQSPIHYLGGVLRKLEQERDAKNWRKGEPTAIGEINARELAKLGKK